MERFFNRIFDNRPYQDIVSVLRLGQNNQAVLIHGAQLMLDFLKAPGHENFQKEILAIAVDHFRKRKTTSRNVEFGPVDDAFFPLLIEAATRRRDDVQRRRSDGRLIFPADQSHVDVSGVNLDGADLSHRDLSHIDFHKATLRGANLTSAIVTHGGLSETDLTNIRAARADFTGSVLLNATFRSANLQDAKLVESFTNGATFHNTDLTRADFSRARMDGVDLRGATIDNANFTYATLYEAELTGVNLGVCASISGAKLYGAKGVNTFESRRLYIARGANFDKPEPSSESGN